MAISNWSVSSVIVDPAAINESAAMLTGGGRGHPGGVVSRGGPAPAGVRTGHGHALLCPGRRPGPGGPGPDLRLAPGGAALRRAAGSHIVSMQFYVVGRIDKGILQCLVLFQTIYPRF